MTTKQVVDNFVNTTASIEIAFTATTFPVVIEAFTASNTSTVNAAYTCYLSSASGPLKAQIKDKVVVWGENDLGIGIVNQIIPVGGTLKIESTAINSIYFTVTGREITA